MFFSEENRRLEGVSGAEGTVPREIDEIVKGLTDGGACAYTVAWQPPALRALPCSPLTESANRFNQVSVLFLVPDTLSSRQRSCVVPSPGGALAPGHDQRFRTPHRKTRSQRASGPGKEVKVDVSARW